MILLKRSDLTASYLIIIISIGCVLSSCSTVHKAHKGTSPYQSEVSIALKKARDQIGDQYVYGAKGPHSFDCSGLVSYVFRDSHYRLSGSAQHIFDQGKVIPIDEISPGDLIFFKEKSKIFHVSIVSQKIRNQLWVIHSTSSRGVIEEDIMTSVYWKPKIFKAVSISSYQ